MANVYLSIRFQDECTSKIRSWICEINYAGYWKNTNQAVHITDQQNF